VSGVELSILLPAFLAGLLVLATHVPLGQLVLERGIVFIDLAIAQVAGLGVVAADAMGWEPRGWSVQISAVSAALLAALFLLWSERRLAAMQEAVIGVVFVLAASAEIIILGFNPHGAEHLKDLLVGQILWVEPYQLVPTAILYAAVLGALALFDLRRRRWLFYALFAVTITASVQLVGVFLVFASLIVPALAAAAARWRIAAGYTIGLAGYALGLLASAVWDLPTGAAVVCALAIAASAASLLRAAIGSGAATRSPGSEGKHAGPHTHPGRRFDIDGPSGCGPPLGLERWGRLRGPAVTDASVSDLHACCESRYRGRAGPDRGTLMPQTALTRRASAT
jgi:zinc/manganese transport system permease protein